MAYDKDKIMTEHKFKIIFKPFKHFAICKGEKWGTMQGNHYISFLLLPYLEIGKIKRSCGNYLYINFDFLFSHLSIKIGKLNGRST